MKHLIFTSLLIIGCNPTTEQIDGVDSIGSAQFYAKTDSIDSHKMIALADGVYTEDYKGEFIYLNNKGCLLRKDDLCERLFCNDDSIDRLFCDVKKWSVDSLSFDLNGVIYKGRFY